jgi:hypothetical protein
MKRVRKDDKEKENIASRIYQAIRNRETVQRTSFCAPLAKWVRMPEMRGTPHIRIDEWEISVQAVQTSSKCNCQYICIALMHR